MAMVLSARRSSRSPPPAHAGARARSSPRAASAADHIDMIAAVTSLTLAEPLPRRLSALSGPQISLSNASVASITAKTCTESPPTPAAPAAPLFTTCDPPGSPRRASRLSEELPLSRSPRPPGCSRAGAWAWLVAAHAAGRRLLGARRCCGRAAAPRAVLAGRARWRRLLGEGGVHVERRPSAPSRAASSSSTAAPRRSRAAGGRHLRGGGLARSPRRRDDAGAVLAKLLHRAPRRGRRRARGGG